MMDGTAGWQRGTGGQGGRAARRARLCALRRNSAHLRPGRGYALCACRRCKPLAGAQQVGAARSALTSAAVPLSSQPVEPVSLSRSTLSAEAKLAPPDWKRDGSRSAAAAIWHAALSRSFQSRAGGAQERPPRKGFALTSASGGRSNCGARLPNCRRRCALPKPQVTLARVQLALAAFDWLAERRRSAPASSRQRPVSSALAAPPVVASPLALAHSVPLGCVRPCTHARSLARWDGGHSARRPHLRSREALLLRRPSWSAHTRLHDGLEGARTNQLNPCTCCATGQLPREGFVGRAGAGRLVRAA